MAGERMVEILGLLKSLNMLSWAIFSMPISTACFRWGLSLKVCTMKLRMKGDHLVVVPVLMGRMQGRVVLVQKNVGSFAIGAVKPGGEVFE